MNSAQKILREIEKITEKHFLPIIGPEKGKVLADVVKKYKPKRILEIGTLVGYSAILMASNRPKRGSSKIISIELRENAADIARENIKEAGFDDVIEVRVGDAKEVIPKLKNEKERFDMVFLDAVKDEYLAYLKLAEPMLEEGAVVVADNAGVFAEAMEDYFEYVRNSGKYSSEFVPVGADALEVSVKL
jgi:predicted O-methyltransferase YrrM